MNETAAVAFFITHAIQAARSMPMGDARTYLRGLLACAEDRPEILPLRRCFQELCSCDDQLSLIAADPTRAGAAEPE